jgi:hypothetical protein
MESKLFQSSESILPDSVTTTSWNISHSTVFFTKNTSTNRKLGLLEKLLGSSREGRDLTQAYFKMVANPN